LHGGRARAWFTRFLTVADRTSNADGCAWARYLVSNFIHIVKIMLNLPGRNRPGGS
jgi:hypothetical protein